MNKFSMVALLLVGLTGRVIADVAAPDPVKLYEANCLTCHAPNRLGGMGPALLPDALVRLKKADAYKTIADGLPATQMPGFGKQLQPAEIQALTDWLYTSPTLPPKWDASDIEASRIVNSDNLDLPAKPVFKADPMNITLVVEGGDHHITVLDGDKMEPITRFPTRFALHGGPKFTEDGRFVFWASRDGWITKYDLWNLKVVAEVRAGINTRNMAVSSDGKTVMVANYLPHTLVALSGRDLALIKVIPVVDAGGKTSRVSAVYDARPRHSFIAALKDIPEVWEIPYDADKGATPLSVRQIKTDDYLDDFFFDQDYQFLIGASREGAKGQVIQLDSGHKVADLALSGMPHLGSGITWDWTDSQGQVHRVMASPNLKDHQISVIDMKTWQVIKVIPTLGPGFFLRSHENSPYAWADVFSGVSKDVMQVIDKQRLEVVATVQPTPGKTATHVEFDRYGKYALVSIWEMDGAVVVYDAKTLKEIKRLPMKRPVGKYNVWNKTRLSEGTSH
jgi:hypothetical protein